MKKILCLILACILSVLALASCDSTGDESSAVSGDELITVTVGASPAPHAEILRQVVDDMAAAGYNLVIKEYNDYVIPNTAVQEGEIDANFFQHKPYLDTFNAENGTDLVSVGVIHYEPLGIYAGKTASIDSLADGASVAIPNDASNGARALFLLQDAGLITLPEDAGLTITVADIVSNPKNLDIQEMEAATLPSVLQDVDIAVINGNYAINGGLSIKDALLTEGAASLGAQTYGNIVAVKAGNEENAGIKKLVELLKSDKVKQYINDTYDGAVIPVE